MLNINVLADYFFASHVEVHCTLIASKGLH